MGEYIEFNHLKSSIQQSILLFVLWVDDALVLTCDIVKPTCDRCACHPVPTQLEGVSLYEWGGGSCHELSTLF